MKYLIIGVGGTGACIGGFLAHQGHEVAFAARGRNLEVLQEQGLVLKTDLRGDLVLRNLQVSTLEAYQGSPEIIILAVKRYSLDGIVPELARFQRSEPWILPILNGLGVAESIQAAAPGLKVLDGCIYINAHIERPGTIVQKGPFFRVVFGERRRGGPAPVLQALAQDLAGCGIQASVSEDIARDVFAKFSFISAYAACGAYFDATAGTIQATPRMRALFTRLCDEATALGEAMGIAVDPGLPALNHRILDAMLPGTTASLQKDLQQGTQSELDSLVFDVVRRGARLGLDLSGYRKVARQFGFEA